MQHDSMERPSMDTTNNQMGVPSITGNQSATWDLEEKYWFDNFTSRPYVTAGPDSWDRFRPAYRYGYESAQHHVGRSWDEAENDLRSGWERYEHRPKDEHSTWDHVKEAVRDAWHRVTGQRTEGDERDVERMEEETHHRRPRS